MTVLHLGVTDELTYSHGGKTVVDVAEILEDKYHVMQKFFEKYESEIVDLMGEAITGAFESVMRGAPPPPNPHQSAMEKIQEYFNTFLDQEQIPSSSSPRIPTDAALKGTNHRLKHPYRKSNPRRPSFIDTSTYEDSFRAWVE